MPIPSRQNILTSRQLRIKIITRFLKEFCRKIEKYNSRAFNFGYPKVKLLKSIIFITKEKLFVMKEKNFPN